VVDLKGCTPRLGERGVVTGLRADFDVAALHAALDAQRLERGLTWAAATREVNRAGEWVARRPVASSTLTGMVSRGSIEGDGVLQMLLWLGRTPESFVPGHPAPNRPEMALPHVPADRILRWDVRALGAAINAHRVDLGLTWQQTAHEIGGFTSGMLTNLTRSERIGFPRVMRLVAWLDRPAVDFTVLRRRS
jgi:hypothetical protein